ncbi:MULTISPECIES: hypothetical protein [Pantoea]|uniref:hypothetical protein n=1 Tax=Pantoea TaxID=53335 RepID=UPI0012D73648|nr:MULTISPECIES: hypothetical protein [Pantoea]
MTTVATERKKFVTPAAAFQVNPAAIVGRFAAHYSARHQQNPGFFAPLTTLGGWRLQGLFSNALHKCKNEFSRRRKAGQRNN